MKRFVCHDIIPGCSHVFTGADDQSVLDQVIEHAATDHGLVKPPLALVELVVATTYSFTPTRARGHLRLVGAEVADHVGPVGEAEQQASGHHGAGSIGRLEATRPAPDGVVSLAIDRLTRNVTSAQAATDPATRIQPSPAHDTYRHECLLYRGTDEFLASTIPFIRAGLELDQPVMVAVAEPRLGALRDAIGEDAERVVFADMAELGHNPAQIIPAWREFIGGSAGRPTRGIGEPIWVGRRDAEIAESQIHEALLNMAVDPTTPFWLLCPYDAAGLDEAVVAEAHRSHPVLVESGSSTCSQSYSGTPHALELFAAGLPEPVEPVATVVFEAELDNDVASRVLSFAANSGLPARRAAKLAAAVDEIAIAGILSSDGSSGAVVSVRLWQDGVALVCQVDDAGLIVDPMVCRNASVGTKSRERGIRLANELCDLVQVRSNTTGTTVRVHSWL